MRQMVSTSFLGWNSTACITVLQDELDRIRADHFICKPYTDRILGDY